MNLYIVLYTHRHGSDTWPVFTTDDAPAPSAEEIASELADFEPDDEWVSIIGPYPVPTLLA